MSASDDGHQGQQHTQFLDLTDGEGGDRPSSFDDNDVNGGIAVGTSTPGKVVETGQEHTGRWTKAEHEAFLKALQTYGKEWKKVAAKVKTRTVVQTRTHAQKYFQKLQKTIDSGQESVTHVEMGTETTIKPSLSTAQKRRKSAAPGSNKQNRRSSNTTISAAHAIHNLSQKHLQQEGFGVTSAPTSNVHGFDTSQQPSLSQQAPQPGRFAQPGYAWPPAMKIHAPQSITTPSKFPEPSPAATGKRKLAEIAAARMLAGVGTAPDDEAPTPPPMEKTGLDLKQAPPPPLFGGGNRSGGGLALQIVNPSSLGIAGDQRKLGGMSSPGTPWEGQLRALVTEHETAKMDIDGGEEDLSIPFGGLHPVCGPGGAFGRSALHKAVCDGDVQGLRMLLLDIPNQSERVLNRIDEAGYGPLHTACALGLLYGVDGAIAFEMAKILLSSGPCDPSLVDKAGNTPLHWAARAGDYRVADVLLRKNSPLDHKNAAGEAPLHWAMRAGSRAVQVVNLLLEGGARPGVLSANHRRPLDVAGEGFLDDEASLAALKEASFGKKQTKEYKKCLKDTANERRDARTNLLIRSPPSRTLVLHHPECLEHHPKSETDWEAPDRVTTIMGRILPSSDSTGDTETSGIFPHEVAVSQEFDRARLDLLKRVHSTEYLSFVSDLSRDLESQMKESGEQATEGSEGTFSGNAPVVPFTPLVQRSMIKVDESRVKLGMNSDTSFSAGSLKAARRAAGAVQHAVDW